MELMAAESLLDVWQSKVLIELRCFPWKLTSCTNQHGALQNLSSGSPAFDVEASEWSCFHLLSSSSGLYFCSLRQPRWWHLSLASHPLNFNSTNKMPPAAWKRFWALLFLCHTPTNFYQVTQPFLSPSVREVFVFAASPQYFSIQMLTIYLLLKTK